MADLDPDDYESLVVRPARGLAHLPDDLIARYAIDLRMPDKEIADRIQQVRAHWTKNADPTTNTGRVYKAFIEAHRELEATHGDRLNTNRWWRAWHEQHLTRPSEIDALMAADLPDLHDELARLPIDPVLDLVVQSDAPGVRLTWRSSPNHDGTVHYRVVRKVGCSPAGPDDGEVIATTTKLTANDRIPPVACAVFYAVFAGHGTTVWSQPTVAETQVIPPVFDVQTTTESDVIAVQWRTHPEVTLVHVQREIGSTGQTRALDVVNGSIRDTDVEEGMEYIYSMVAAYHCPVLKAEITATPVTVHAAVRPEPAPVTELRVELVRSEADPRVQIAWPQPIGAQVVIRKSTTSPPWGVGERVSEAEIAGYGQELNGAPILRDGWMTLIAPAEPALSTYVPFTVDQHGGIRGQEATFAHVMPVRQLYGERFGSQLLVSWAWPDGVKIAKVSWPDDERQITRQQYIDLGGCRIPLNGQAATIEVTSIIPGDREKFRSTPALVHIAAEPPRLSYTLERRRSRLTGEVQCIVRFTRFTGSDLIECTVLVVIAEGHCMPRNPTLGRVVSSGEEVLVPGGMEIVRKLTLPRLRRPYWVRCFVAESSEVLLVDPPLSQLKVH